MSEHDDVTACHTLEADRAAATSLVFRNLAIGFRYPAEQVYDQLAGPLFWEQLRDAREFLGQDSAEHSFTAITRPELPPQRELESAYLGAFEDVGGNREFCPLYEGSYSVIERYSDLLIELKTLYRHFGLAMSESTREQPDHVTAELEFMHFLLHKQAELLETGAIAEPYRRAQRDFLARHLQQWIPAMARRADGFVGNPFYRYWTELTADVITNWPLHGRAMMSIIQ